MRILSAIAVLGCLATPASAEDVPPERSAELALMLPLGVTGLGVGLVALGSDNQTRGEKVLLGMGALVMVAGPPLGRIYARDISWFGAGLEAGGVFLIASAVVGDDQGSLGVFLMGTGVYSIGALYQIITAPNVVIRANRQRMTIVPTSGIGGTGLSLVGSF